LKVKYKNRFMEKFIYPKYIKVHLI